MGQLFKILVLMKKYCCITNFPFTTIFLNFKLVLYCFKQIFVLTFKVLPVEHSLLKYALRNWSTEKLIKLTS